MAKLFPNKLCRYCCFALSQIGTFTHFLLDFNLIIYVEKRCLIIDDHWKIEYRTPILALDVSSLVTQSRALLPVASPLSSCHCQLFASSFHLVLVAPSMFTGRIAFRFLPEQLYLFKYSVFYYTVWNRCSQSNTCRPRIDPNGCLIPRRRILCRFL